DDGEVASGDNGIVGVGVIAGEDKVAGAELGEAEHDGGIVGIVGELNEVLANGNGVGAGGSGYLDEGAVGVDEGESEALHEQFGVGNVQCPQQAAVEYKGARGAIGLAYRGGLEEGAGAGVGVEAVDADGAIGETDDGAESIGELLDVAADGR